MLGTMTLEDAAQEAVGNWKKFDSFVWWREREMDDADLWAIVYTSNRDSGLIDQSNSAVIAKTLEALTEGDDADVVAERHSHWLESWSGSSFPRSSMTCCRRFLDCWQ